MNPAAIVDGLRWELEAQPDVEGLLFFGSAQRGEATAHSDIDLYVLRIGDQAWHEGRVVDGTPIELSFSPLHHMRARVLNRHVVVVHAFAFGAVLLDRTGEVAALAGEARSIWAEGPRELSDAERLRWRFHLTELLRDVADLEPDSTTARHCAAGLVHAAIDAACAVNRLWPIPRKAFAHGLRERVPPLAPLVEAYYASGAVQGAIAVGEHVLTELGGPALEYRTEAIRVPE